MQNIFQEYSIEYEHCIVLYINEHRIIIKMEVFLVLLSKLIAPQLEKTLWGE